MRTQNFRSIQVPNSPGVRAMVFDQLAGEIGSIYKLHDIRYDIDTQAQWLVFEVIGQPVDQTPDVIRIEYA